MIVLLLNKIVFIFVFIIVIAKQFVVKNIHILYLSLTEILNVKYTLNEFGKKQLFKQS